MSIDAATIEVTTIPLVDVVPDPEQPRQHFGADDLQTLAESMDANGLLQPIIVRSAGDATGPGYIIIAGERRYRAATLLGWDAIPAMVGDDVDVLITQMIENIARADMRPVETARGYQRLIDTGRTASQVAQLVGVNTRTINLALRLLELTPHIQDLVERGHIEPQHARQMADLTPEYQQVALKRYLNSSRRLTNMEFGGVCDVLLKQQQNLTMFDDTIAPEDQRRAKRDLDDAVDRAAAVLGRLSEMTPDQLLTTVALNPEGYTTKIGTLAALVNSLEWRVRRASEAAIVATSIEGALDTVATRAS